MPSPPAKKKRRRIACIGAGRASLTVATRSRAPGYHVTVFDQEISPRPRHDLSQIPRFRLPVEVIDEESRLHPRSRRRVQGWW